MRRGPREVRSCPHASRVDRTPHPQRDRRIRGAHLEHREHRRKGHEHTDELGAPVVSEQHLGTGRRICAAMRRATMSRPIPARTASGMPTTSHSTVGTGPMPRVRGTAVSPSCD